jgi:Holliday junction resolvase RusA-like endonuclease
MQPHVENPFYDFVGFFVHGPIPSSQPRYKNLPDKPIAILKPISNNVRQFRKEMKDALTGFPIFNKPYKGDVLISLEVGLTEQEYASRDIDNMMKTLLDALENIVYLDDKQVVVLRILKKVEPHNCWFMGIKFLSGKNDLWRYEPLYLDRRMGF